MNAGRPLITTLALLLSLGVACSETKNLESTSGDPQADAAPAKAAAPAEPAKPAAMVVPEAGSMVYAQPIQTIDGDATTLGAYKGKTLLIVNTASECGFTPQYEGLQALYSEYKDKGLVVVGFPSNDFGGQEPGSADEIKTFCKVNYGVDFPLMAKVHAKGPEKAPIYKVLTEETPDGIKGEVKWNFTKFLVSPKGEVVARFESKVKPDAAELKEAVEANLPKS